MNILPGKMWFETESEYLYNKNRIWTKPFNSAVNLTVTPTTRISFQREFEINLSYKLMIKVPILKDPLRGRGSQIITSYHGGVEGGP